MPQSTLRKNKQCTNWRAMGYTPREGVEYKDWTDNRHYCGRTTQVEIELGNQMFRGVFQVKDGKCQIQLKEKTYLPDQNPVMKFITSTKNVVFIRENCIVNSMLNGSKGVFAKIVVYIAKIVDDTLIEKL